MLAVVLLAGDAFGARERHELVRVQVRYARPLAEAITQVLEADEVAAGRHERHDPHHQHLKAPGVQQHQREQRQRDGKECPQAATHPRGVGQLEARRPCKELLAVRGRGGKRVQHERETPPALAGGVMLGDEKVRLAEAPVEEDVHAEEALAFARERYSFAEGDRQRGRNQMAVITGVINRMLSPAVLNDFSGLMEGLEGSFESDIPYDGLAGLVRMQLSDGGAWNIVTYSVDGTGKRASTYSMSSSVYVMEPDQDTVDHAKELIRQVENGGTLVQE